MKIHGNNLHLLSPEEREKKHTCCFCKDDSMSVKYTFLSNDEEMLYVCNKCAAKYATVDPKDIVDKIITDSDTKKQDINKGIEKQDIDSDISSEKKEDYDKLTNKVEPHKITNKVEPQIVGNFNSKEYYENRVKGIYTYEDPDLDMKKKNITEMLDHYSKAIGARVSRYDHTVTNSFDAEVNKELRDRVLNWSREMEVEEKEREKETFANVYNNDNFIKNFENMKDLHKIIKEYIPIAVRIYRTSTNMDIAEFKFLGGFSYRYNLSLDGYGCMKNISAYTFIYDQRIKTRLMTPADFLLNNIVFIDYGKNHTPMATIWNSFNSTGEFEFNDVKLFNMYYVRNLIDSRKCHKDGSEKGKPILYIDLRTKASFDDL